MFPIETTCRSQLTQLLISLTSKTVPAPPSTAAQPEGPCQVLIFGRSCHAILFGEICIHLPASTGCSHSWHAFCEPSQSTPEAIHLRKRRRIHPVLQPPPPHLSDARDLGFPQGDAPTRFVEALQGKLPSQSARAKGNKKWHDLITSVTVVQQLKEVWHEALIN